MRRREFISVIGGAAAWPLVSWAQQGKRIRRIGVLLFGTPDNDPDLGAFLRGLRELGYVDGQNIAIEYRYAEGKPERLRGLAGELVTAVLVNKANSANAETTLRDVEPAARERGLQIQVLKADTNDQINAAFESMGRDRPDALFVSITPFFLDRRVHLTQLAAFHRLPTAYSLRDFVEVGGLMSYGASIADTYRHVGAYTGRILKGAKPADLPVVQSTKIELIINRETARMLGLTVPPSLLGLADEVIE